MASEPATGETRERWRVTVLMEDGSMGSMYLDTRREAREQRQRLIEQGVDPKRVYVKRVA